MKLLLTFLMWYKMGVNVSVRESHNEKELDACWRIHIFRFVQTVSVFYWTTVSWNTQYHCSDLNTSFSISNLKYQYHLLPAIWFTDQFHEGKDIEIHLLHRFSHYPHTNHSQSGYPMNEWIGKVVEDVFEKFVYNAIEEVLFPLILDHKNKLFEIAVLQWINSTAI